MAEDIDRFIQEQKSKLARERNDLQQETTRKVMEEAPSNYPTTGRNGFKENIPPSEPATIGKGNAVPSGSHEDIKEKLARERQEEYKKFMAEKELRSAPRKQEGVPDNGRSLGIPSRDSAKDRARAARNKEYNEFLKSKGKRLSQKPVVGNKELSPDINKRPPYNPITGKDKENPSQNPPNGYPPYNARQPDEPQDRGIDRGLDRGLDRGGVDRRREAASQTPRPILKEYDDRPPPGPRRGWGTPQPDYDEMLRRKRDEEARYRRYDEDYDYYQPRGGIRPSYSDSHLNRYPEDGRYSRARQEYYDQESDRRRVRFSDQPGANGRAYPPADNPRYDRPPVGGREFANEPDYDWGISRGGRSRTLPEMERQKPGGNGGYDAVDNKPPRAKSATLPTEEVGIAIGNRDTASATRRKKEQYRKELEQQMKEAQDAKKREKRDGLRINASGASDPAKRSEGLGGFGTQRGNSRTPVPSQQPPTQPPQGYQPSFINQAYPNAQVGGVPPPQVPNLGLEEALAKSRLGGVGLREGNSMIEQPFSINNYSSILGAPAATTSTDPYMYYGVRNPLDPDPGDYATRMMQQPSSYNTGYPSQQYGTYPAPRSGPIGGGIPLNLPPQENLTLIGAAQTALIRNESSIKNFVGDTSPRTVNDPKSYQAILRQQMMEKDMKKRLEKEEKERYDAKLEAEAANYNPWGKGGGGAPMRDNKGKIVADLRQLHSHNEQTLNDPQSAQLQLYSDQAPAATTTAAPGYPGIPGLPERSPRPGAAAVKADNQQSGTTGSKNPQDEYKEYLKQQVEDKKRREAEEKEKLRLEEEKEERRLADQRQKMQRDFEAEQLRQKNKEDEKKRQKEDLEKKIEEERKEADKKKHEVVEAKRRQGEQEKQKQDQVQARNDQKDRYSPPIPTLRTKQDEPRVSSPPVPALRKNDKDKLDSPRKSKGIHGTPRRPPGEFDVVDWMRSIDPDLVAYAPSLAENGYKTLKTVRRINRHTLMQFCPDMKHGHFEAVLHEVDRLQTPTSRKEQEEAAAKGRGGNDGPGRDPRDVMTALSAMRRQLHSEQRRIQSQLDQNKQHDPYAQSQPKASSRRASPQVDVFEVARHKAPVAVRREPLTHHVAAADFSNLKNRESNSRQRLREQFPSNPNSDLTLEAQQRALLRHQQEKLENLRRGNSKRPIVDQMPSMNPRDLGRSDSPLLALESESAFIGINNGVADIPRTPPRRKRPPSPRKEYGEPSTSGANRSKPKDPLGSTMSFDNDTIDFLAKKNKERNKALNNLEADVDSLVDADDVLTRFMMRSSHDRPKSAKSEDLSLWLQPSTID